MKNQIVRDGLRKLDAAELVCLLGDQGVIAFVASSPSPYDEDSPDSRSCVVLSASPDFFHASWFAFGWAAARRARALPYGRGPTEFYPRDRDALGYERIGEPLRFTSRPGDFDFDPGEE